MTTIQCQRHLFDVPDDIHYLNCAYISPLLRTAKAAAVQGLTSESHPWTITAGDFFAPLEIIRESFAQLINATADEIAIVPSASYGIATAAANMPVKTGQTIVTLQDQYPSNVYAWRELASRAGAAHRIVERPADDDWTAAILEAIDDSVALAALPNNHWMDGGLVDLPTIGDKLRAVGAGLVVDASQSLGAMPLDVARVQPDFLVTAGYKWMLCPYGFSLLYVAPHRHTGVPLEHNPHNRVGGEDFPRLAELKNEFATGARRFDAGERAHFTLAPAAAVTLQQLAQWGVDNIYATLSALTQRVAERAKKFNLETLPPTLRAGHFIGLRFPATEFPDGPPTVLHDALREAKVVVSLRGSSLRITPHLYNNDADIAALFDCFEAALV
ncbi:MAG: aminotransferase class V-fold PLP-dependent enzyme [Gammaproteobacteria bacterium]|nr:aminotransferase class V-fold PLP-dependent enzyme [Gammaproteobacteria bacterium]